MKENQSERRLRAVARMVAEEISSDGNRSRERVNYWMHKLRPYFTPLIVDRAMVTRVRKELEYQIDLNKMPARERTDIAKILCRTAVLSGSADTPA